MEGHRFSVCQFLEDGSYEYIVRDESAETAMMKFCSVASSPTAVMGFVKRVIITDSEDNTNAEWIFGKGLVFPRLFDIQAMNKDVQRQQASG